MAQVQTSKQKRGQWATLSVSLSYPGAAILLQHEMMSDVYVRDTRQVGEVDQFLPLQTLV